MNGLNLRTVLLQSQLKFQRWSLSTMLLVLLLLLALLGQFYWLPQQQAQIQLSQQALAKLEKQLSQSAPKAVSAKAALPLPEQKLAQFYAALGQRGYLEQQNHAFFTLAEKAGLSLKQGDYKLQHERNGKYFIYTAQLPVKGTYTQITQFCQQSLLQMPFLALDEINFKREQVANRTLDAKLKFTLYLSENNQAPVDDEPLADSTLTEGKGKVAALPIAKPLKAATSPATSPATTSAPPASAKKHAPSHSAVQASAAKSAASASNREAK